MKSIIKTLVLPVAGKGKRLQPLTLSMPKALVPMNGKPLLEYALDEISGTDIERAIVIASPGHKEQLELFLEEKRRVMKDVEFILRFQDKPAGNGHVLLMARDLLAGIPFAVRFCDDVLFSKVSPVRILSDIYAEKEASVLLLERVPKERVSSYGVVKLAGGRAPGDRIFKLAGIVEKPAIEDAPSDLTIIGGYVLAPEILDHLKILHESLSELSDDALLLTDAFEAELLVGNNIYGWEFSGKRFDCGTLRGLKHAEDVLRSGNR